MSEDVIGPRQVASEVTSARVIIVRVDHEPRHFYRTEILCVIAAWMKRTARRHGGNRRRLSADGDQARLLDDIEARNRAEEAPRIWVRGLGQRGVYIEDVFRGPR